MVWAASGREPIKGAIEGRPQTHEASTSLEQGASEGRSEMRVAPVRPDRYVVEGRS